MQGKYLRALGFFAAASRSAMLRPMRFAAPVISATCPSSGFPAIVSLPSRESYTLAKPRPENTIAS